MIADAILTPEGRSSASYLKYTQLKYTISHTIHVINHNKVSQ